MKYLITTLLLVILYSVLLPDVILSANDNQLITEIKVFDNDSTFRYSYLYDNLGNKVLETKFYQQDSIWIRKSLNEWIYSGNKCICQRERIWRDNNWSFSYSIDYEYNNEQLVSEIHSIFNNGVASLIKKTAYQYDKTDLTSKKEYSWLTTGWILSIETDFTYLQNGKTDSLTTINFQSGNGMTQFLSTFIYNLDGTLKSQLFQEKSGNDWVNSELINWYYILNSTSTLIRSIQIKKWMSDTSSFENTQRTDYVYNDSIELVTETYQRWSTMFWKNDIRYDYQYDKNNKLTKKTLSKPIYNDWRGLISINYSNPTNNNLNDIESKFEFWGGNTGELTTSYIPFLFNSEQKIQKGRRMQISYKVDPDTTLFTNVLNNSNQSIPVYPNPSDGIFYINTQKHTINSWIVSDIKGQILKIQNQSFQSGVIDLTDFPKGIYILRVTTPNEHLIQKLIKE